MNKIYTFALFLSAGLLFSCQTETPETESPSLNRTTNSQQGKQLIIINDSDFTMSGGLHSYGSEDNMTVNSNIKIMGNAVVPANYQLTYKNYALASNPQYQIDPWYVRVNSSAPVAYHGIEAHQIYGQLFDVTGSSPAKYAHWRYLKVKFTTTTIPGFTNPVTMFIQLPSYSGNNVGEKIVDLSPYGHHKDLYITQTSYINESGDTVLKLDSELVDHLSTY